MCTSPARPDGGLTQSTEGAELVTVARRSARGPRPLRPRTPVTAAHQAVTDTGARGPCPSGLVVGGTDQASRGPVGGDPCRFGGYGGCPADRCRSLPCSLSNTATPLWVLWRNAVVVLVPGAAAMLFVFLFGPSRLSGLFAVTRRVVAGVVAFAGFLAVSGVRFAVRWLSLPHHFHGRCGEDRAEGDHAFHRCVRLGR